MFPAFRIVPDGPLSGGDTFISNVSFYSGQWGAPLVVAAQTFGDYNAPLLFTTAGCKRPARPSPRSRKMDL